jgi:putative Holliday junction resolvase
MTSRASEPRASAGTRILAVDYGRRRIGLALSDELHLTARPLAVLSRKNRSDDLRRIKEIVTEHGVGCVVVGHPLRLDGTAGEMAAEAARFAGRLRLALNLPIVLADERLSSWAAKEMQAESVRGARKHSKRDDLAAAIILRDYLEHERETKSSPR